MVLAFVYVISKFEMCTLMPNLCKEKCLLTGKCSSISVPRCLSRCLKYLKSVELKT